MSETKTYLDGLLGNQANIQTTGVTNPNNGNPNLANNQPQTTKDTNDNPHPGVTFTNTNYAQQISTPTAPASGGSMVDDILNRIRNANPFGTPSGTGGTAAPPPTTTQPPPTTGPGPGGTQPPYTGPNPGATNGTNPLDPNRYQLNNTYWNEILNRQINAPGGPQGGLPSGLDLSNLTQGSFGNLNWDSLNQVAQNMGLGNFKMQDGSFDWRQLLDAITEPFIQGDFWNSETKEWTIPQGLAGMFGGPLGEFVYRQAANALEKKIEFEGPDLSESTRSLQEKLNRLGEQAIQDRLAARTNATFNGLSQLPQGMTRNEFFDWITENGWTASRNPETMSEQEATALNRFFDLYRQGGLQRALQQWGQGSGGMSDTGNYDAPTIEEFLRNFTTADGGAEPMTPQQWEQMMRMRRGDVRR